MKTLAAAALLGAASLVPLAIAAEAPSGADSGAAPAIEESATPLQSPIGQSEVPDARSMASDAEVGEARRYYRAQCETFESAAFCECVTAGVAQALAPEDVRLAARTSRERLPAMGDAATAGLTDQSNEPLANQSTRIEEVEAFYADACAAHRAT
ncbi:MAG: hypothetical protein AB7J28_04630 [Hyphomonadaceae bacterium]